MSWLPDLIAGLRDISIVVFLGYGLRLMKQQNELLEREKALKQSEIDVHRATIERLKVLQAPAIARDLEQMTRTANDYADMKGKLEERVGLLAKENEKMKAEVDRANIIGIAAGSLDAAALLEKTRSAAWARAILGDQPPGDDYWVKMLNENIAHISTTAKRALKGEKPQLDYLKQWLEEIKKNSAHITKHVDQGDSPAKVE
jgi:hypothetical protein